LLKEHLMTQIRREDREDQASLRVNTKWLRSTIATAAVATAAAVTFVMLPTSSGGSGRQGAQAGSTATGGSGAQAGNTPMALLENIALAAEHQEPLKARDDQFVYIESKVSYASVSEAEKTMKLDPLHRRETWQSVDGQSGGLVQEGRRQLATDPDARPGTPGAETAVNLRNLSTLPSDPDRMYDWLRRTAPKYTGKKAEQGMFVLVGDLIREALVPPAQSAALYRAAARIPGVTVVKDAVDAAGRHGLAIARVDSESLTRDEWIFDKKTHEFLGERSVAGADNEVAKKGQVIGNAAVLRRAVVDKVGRRP
jgi:hypothetical protein